ncbi:MAG: DEAD/DEAH box helicase, partial [Chloroflexota bacterium]|nr:DEAD/DEAH box helicase [Chloroflexota bacterium]
APSRRSGQKTAESPESEGALARSRPDHDHQPRRRRRRRPRRAAAEVASAPSQPLLFPVPSMPGLFSELPELERAVAEAGWTKPTPIQERAMPVLRSGADLVGQAQTGSGKTAAFGLPIMEALDPGLASVQALVVVPTRELAEQVSGELERLGTYRRIHPASVYGGVGIERQIQAIRRGAQVVVGTPGRLLDHLERGTLSLAGVQIVILDEADRMLDMGFQPDIERLLRRTPSSRQTALFSATIPPDIHELIYRYLRDPQWVRIESPQATVETVEQLYYEVADRDKFDGLCELLDMHDWPSILIFRRTQRGVDRLEAQLRRHRYSVAAIHGGMSQADRQRALNSFAEGSVRVLVATNVAARGLDIPDVSHVVNYDMPEDFDTYVHRVGRTARIGKEGTAVTFVSEADIEMFEILRDRLQGQLREQRLALYG